MATWFFLLSPILSFILFCMHFRSIIIDSSLTNVSHILFWLEIHRGQCSGFTSVVIVDKQIHLTKLSTKAFKIGFYLCEVRSEVFRCMENLHNQSDMVAAKYISLAMINMKRDPCICYSPKLHNDLLKNKYWWGTENVRRQLDGIETVVSIQWSSHEIRWNVLNLEHSRIHKTIH